SYAAGPVSVAVLHVPPTVMIAGPSAIGFAADYSLSLSASDAGHTIQSWTIDWGDGVIESLPGTATTANHFFAYQPSPYNIGASVTDDVGTYAGNSLA